MASQTQGIQQLLQAEKRAAEKVGEARKRELELPVVREGAGNGVEADQQNSQVENSSTFQFLVERNGRDILRNAGP